MSLWQKYGALVDLLLTDLVMPEGLRDWNDRAPANTLRHG